MVCVEKIFHCNFIKNAFYDFKEYIEKNKITETRIKRRGK